MGVAGIFQISPDGSTVVYRADQDTIGLYELYSVAIGGETAPVKLNPNLASNTRIGQNFQISPDGRTVVYPADELYRVPIGGGAAPVQLNPTIVGSFRGVVSFQISPVDSRLVVYRARQDSDCSLLSIVDIIIHIGNTKKAVTNINWLILIPHVDYMISYYFSATADGIGFRHEKA